MAILDKIQKFVLSKNNGWLMIAIFLLILLIILQSTRKSVKYEGFQQKEPFTMQRGANIYDEFYSEIHDKLYDTESRSEREATEIIDATQPDKDHSVFLDIGCGTGCLVNALKRRGYNAIGVDKSKAMIDTGKERHHDAKNSMQCGDATDPMLFERGVFSHILCMDRTVYEIPDRIAFFRNCKHWLQPGGYLILHLVEPENFNAIVPLGQPKGLLKTDTPLKTADGKRVTDTAIDFLDFKYNSKYDFSQLATDGVVTQTEKFTDATSNKVRQNEHVMHMSSPNSILEDSRYCGFLMQGAFVSTEDKAQKVYILKAL
jgi:SAM-dependent methyltransferase